jgi:hypothetical protein
MPKPAGPPGLAKKPGAMPPGQFKKAPGAAPVVKPKRAMPMPTRKGGGVPSGLPEMPRPARKPRGY